MNKKETKISKEIRINKKSARRNYSNQTGITLIALVVTIVVLLILAGVSVNALFGNSGIIEKAKEAQNAMDKAAENDQKQIGELTDWIDNQVNETIGKNEPVTPIKNWTQNKTLVTNGITTYTVGDNYTYECEVSDYTGEWKILGAENGKLLIMSTVDVGTLALKGISGDGTINYLAGYKNGTTKLNEMCAPYGTNARSITVEDINRVTGYIPEHQTTNITSENKYYYDNDTANQSSTVTGTEAVYAGKYGLATALGVTNGNPVTGNTNYKYYPNTLTLSNSGTTVGIATTSKAYKLLFRKADDSDNCEYWIASSCVTCSIYVGASLSMRCVYSGGYVGDRILWSSATGANTGSSCGVRAVVSL